MTYGIKDIKTVPNPNLTNVHESDQRLDIDNLPNELKIRNEFIVYKTEPKFDMKVALLNMQKNQFIH